MWHRHTDFFPCPFTVYRCSSFTTCGKWEASGMHGDDRVAVCSLGSPPSPQSGLRRRALPLLACQARTINSYSLSLGNGERGRMPRLQVKSRSSVMHKFLYSLFSGSWIGSKSFPLTPARAVQKQLGFCIWAVPSLCWIFVIANVLIHVFSVVWILLPFVLDNLSIFLFTLFF